MKYKRSRKKYRPQKSHVGASKVLIVIIILLLAMGTVFAICKHRQKQTQDPLTATTSLPAATENAIHIRSGSSISSPIVATLPKGTSVRLLTKPSGNSQWIKVQTNAGQTGWCIQEYLNINNMDQVLSTLQNPHTDIPSYSISVSIAKQKVTVLNTDGQVVKQFICSTGAAGSRTPTGVYRIAKRGKSFYNKVSKEGGYYWTQFYGNYLFHSVPFGKNYELLSAEADKLGTPASHGCVRLSLDDAKWIYYHIPKGTSVTIH